MPQPIIEINHVTKHYDDGLVRALNDVSLSISAGTISAVMGPSGCGKTTLLNIIGTIDYPTSGTIRFAGKPLAAHKPLHAFRRRWIGFAFQFHHLIPTLTLQENLELPLYADGTLSRKQRQEKAYAILAETGLEHCASKRANQVSGGERQRAAIARALLQDPRIILADEPTGSVDSRNAALVLDVILDRARAKGMTVLMATHNRSVADRAESVICMSDGKIVECA